VQLSCGPPADFVSSRAAPMHFGAKSDNELRTVYVASLQGEFSLYAKAAVTRAPSQIARKSNDWRYRRDAGHLILINL